MSAFDGVADKLVEALHIAIVPEADLGGSESRHAPPPSNNFLLGCLGKLAASGCGY
jgi:hypothetical protein